MRIKTAKHAVVLVAAVAMLGGCAPQTPQPSVPKACLSAAQLNTYSYEELANVAKLLREEKKNIESFEGFISAMKTTVEDYSQMVKSSIYISNVVRFLPVPYAGEVSNSAKLISKTVLNLGGAASALNRYKKSSESFLSGFEKLDRNNPETVDIARLARYADTKLLSDAAELRLELSEISESTAALAAMTQGIANALETTGGYVNQAKSFVGLSPQTDDKAKVAASRNSINARMAQLNQKITALENSAQLHRHSIAKARIYSELALEVEKMDGK